MFIPVHKLLIAGSRNLEPDFWQLDCLIHAMGLSTELYSIISGMARGVDLIAATFAKARGIELIEKPADWSKGKGAGFDRNEEMVQLCTHAIVIWDGNSNGTKDTIRRLHRHKKPYLLKVIHA